MLLLEHVGFRPLLIGNADVKDCCGLARPQFTHEQSVHGGARSRGDAARASEAAGVAVVDRIDAGRFIAHATGWRSSRHLTHFGRSGNIRSKRTGEPVAWYIVRMLAV